MLDLFTLDLFCNKLKEIRLKLIEQGHKFKNKDYTLSFASNAFMKLDIELQMECLSHPQSVMMLHQQHNISLDLDDLKGMDEDQRNALLSESCSKESEKIIREFKLKLLEAESFLKSRCSISWGKGRLYRILEI